MSEPSANLDLTALSDALGEDDRQAMEEVSEKSMMKDKQKDSSEALSQSSVSSPPPANTNKSTTTNSATTNVSAIPALQVESDENHPDPNVRNIKAMFPDMDVDTIQAVLVADGGDFERAINTLLQMSDPSYVPPPPFQRMSQHDEDEQLARSLAAEDERQQHQPIYPSSRGGGGLGSLFGGGGQQNSTLPSRPSYDPNQLNYQPRVRRTTSGQQQRTPSESNQNYQSSGGYNGASSAAWPGSREAKVWQEDLNKMAEVGFAKAASTFSALRQRGEKAFAGGQQQQGNGYKGAEDQPSSSLPGWSSRKSSVLSPASTVSPTIGSSRGFDKDPKPVDDNELAKILARGKEDNKKPSISDRYKKVASNNRTQSKDNLFDQDDDDEELSWDDAGRTGSVAPSFEPIKISDNSEEVEATLKSDLKATDKSKLKLSNTPRNAVSLMEGSTGRGLTSPKPSSAKAGDDDGDDDDSNDLEYVSNPFEDED